MKQNLVALIAILVVVGMILNKDTESTKKLTLPAPKHKLVLVNFGTPASPNLDKLADLIEKHTGVRPEVGGSLSLEPAAMSKCYNSTRDQWDVEQVLDLLPTYDGKVVLAIHNESLFNSSIPSWRYCFGTHRDRSGIISSYQMRERPGEPFDNAQPRLRLNKMVLRYVLEMVYELPRVEDPRSLLHNSIMGPADLDRMEYRI